ncbi:hypothetical protein [Sporosarcina sp. ITBMC105]
MKNKYNGHFKFEIHRELMKASFHHRNYHEGVLSKEDLDLIGWIVMHNLEYCTADVREQVHTLFKLPFATIDRSLERGRCPIPYGKGHDLLDLNKFRIPR